jgi:hypothetical protein
MVAVHGAPLGVLASSALLWSALVACGGQTDSFGDPPDSGAPRPAATSAQGDAGSPLIAPSDASVTDAGTDGAALSSSAPLPGDTIGFVPTGVYGARWGCDIPARYMTGDQFGMEIDGLTGSWPWDELEVSFVTPIAVGVPFVLAVQAPQQLGSNPIQEATGNGVLFSFTPSTTAPQIDSGAFDSATVTFLAIPGADGDPMTLTLRVHFVDGRLLDETFSASATTTRSSCSSSSGG